MSFLRIFDLGRRKVKKRYVVQKRHEVRAKTSNVMKVTSVNETRKEYLSNLIDISESGIQFLSHHKFEVGHTLEVVVSLPQKKVEIPVLAKVVWIKPGEQKHWGYRVGAAFTDVSARDKGLIGEFILETRARHGKDTSISSDFYPKNSETDPFRKKFTSISSWSLLKQMVDVLFNRSLR